MRLSSKFAAIHPLCFFTSLALGVLVVPIVLIPICHSVARRVEGEVDSDSLKFVYTLMSEIEHTAEQLPPLNFTAENLARLCSSFFGQSEVSFSDIRDKVAPKIFQTLYVVPFVSEISYIGSGGMFFSYYLKGQQPVAVYANSSSSSNLSSYNWYKQLVDQNTGDLLGNAIPSRPVVDANDSRWFREAFNNSSQHFASSITLWNADIGPVLINTAKIGNEGLISVGVPVSSLEQIFSSINLRDASLYLMSRDGRVLLQGLPDTQLSLTGNRSVSFRITRPQEQFGNLSCSDPGSGDRKFSGFKTTYLNSTYTLYCSHFEILGAESVYVLAVPDNSLKSIVHKKSKLLLILFLTFIAAVLVALLIFVCIIAGTARREMHLCGRLIEQMEATQQAERKSMRKSKAFIEASHNIRTSLACITTLIENSYREAASMPELGMNLQQMDKCANDLLGILNSILDTSKIEAKEIQLEAEDFNLAQLLEESVDMFHPFAMKKNVDLVLDFQDGSVLEHLLVRGDKGKLKQILSNLLHNAVKFTPEGHITVRARAGKTSLENAIISNNRKGWRKRNSDVVVPSQTTLDSMNFVFEVDDTGKGIPKEKWKSVFEDYNQIKDVSEGQGGTGLGLGSVQSFVRMMGGDIKIIDKDIGERGTCFHFNVVLTVISDSGFSPRKSGNEDIENGIPRDTNQWPCLTIRAASVSRNLSIRSLSPRQTNSPRLAGSARVVLFMGDDERRRVSRRFFERLGVKVWVPREWTDLPFMLRRAEQKLNLSRQGSSSWSDVSHHYQQSVGLSRSVSKNSSRGSSPSLSVHYHSGFLLLVIDTSFGPIQEVMRYVQGFRKVIRSNTNCFKVVLLDKPGTNYRRFLEEEGKLDPLNNIIVSRPFHGSRLIDVIRFLPGFGGSLLRNRSLHMSGTSEVRIREVREPAPGTSKPLSGKRALVVEDNAVLQRAAKAVVMNLGAHVDVCRNGKEAVSTVMDRFRGERTPGPSSSATPIFNFILMDCQMAEMDGYEATRRIREVEKRYDMRIPIIALTAHSGSSKEVKMALDSGMDSYLQKPLKRDSLMEILCKLNIH